MTPTQRARKLLVIALVGANLLVLLLAFYSLDRSKTHYEEQARTLTKNTVNSVDQSLSGTIRSINLALHAVVVELEQQLRSGRINESSINALIARNQERLGELEGVRIADASGMVFLGTGVDKKDAVSWADRDYFIYHQTNADDTMRFRKPRLGRIAKQYIVNFSRRFNYPDGRFAGVVSAPVAVSYFAGLLKQYQLPPDSTLILRDEDLGLVARFPEIPGRPGWQRQRLDGFSRIGGIGRQFCNLPHLEFSGWTRTHAFIPATEQCAHGGHRRCFERSLPRRLVG